MGIKWYVAIQLIICVYLSHAQVKFSFIPSEKHSQKLSRIQDGKKKLDAFYKYKDKAERKHHKEYLDSLKKLPHKPDLPDPGRPGSFLTLPDSATAQDSITWALNTLAHHGQYEEIRVFLEKYPIRDSLGLPRIDTTALIPDLEQRLASLMPEKALPAAPQTSLPGRQAGGALGELEGFASGPPGDLPVDLNKDPKEEVADQSVLLADFQSKVKDEQMAKAQLRMAALKKKYISIPDLSNPDSGVKRNSLEGKPLIDRIYLGGNVSIVSTDPLALDVDLQVGYKLNRQLVLGVGVVWRESFYTKSDSTLAQPKAAHGYSGFVRYEFGKGFFAMAEYGSVRNAPLFSESDEVDRWQHQYLLGVGREFSVLKFAQLTTTILYDFNYRHNDLHPRPFIVWIGYTIDKPRFGKGK